MGLALRSLFFCLELYGFRAKTISSLITVCPGITLTSQASIVLVAQPASSLFLLQTSS